MTEYDYSPGAHQRELEKQAGIAVWAQNPSISNHSVRSGQQGKGQPVTNISYPASNAPSQYNPHTSQPRSRAPSAHSSPQRAQSNSNMISYNGYPPTGASQPAASPSITNPFSDRHAASVHAPVGYTPSRLGSSCTTYHVANDHPQDVEDEVQQEFNSGYQEGYQQGQAAANYYSRAPSAASNASTIRPAFPTTNSYPAGFVPKCSDSQRGMSAAPSAAPSSARSRTKSEGRSIRSGYAGGRSGASEFGDSRSLLEPPIRRPGQPATPYYAGDGRPSPGPAPPLPTASPSRSSIRSLGTKRSMSNLHVPNPLPLYPSQSNYAAVERSFAAANSANQASLAMTHPAPRTNASYSSTSTTTYRTLSHSKSYAAIPGATRTRTVSNVTVGRPSANRYATYSAAPPVPALPQASMPVQINVKPAKPFVLVTDDKAKVALLSDGGANGVPVVWVKQGKQSQGEVIDYGKAGASIVEADLYDNIEPKKKVVTKKKSFFSAFSRSK